MRSSIILTVPFAAAALAQSTTSAPEAMASSSSYNNPFTSYLTQTDSRGVVTGMPSVITSQPSVATALATAVTSQPAAASYISGSPGIPAPVGVVGGSGSSSMSDMAAGPTTSMMSSMGGMGSGAMSSNTTLVIVATGVSSAANSTFTAVAGPNGTAIVNGNSSSSATGSMSSGMSTGSSSGTPTSGGSGGSGTTGGSAASSTSTTKSGASAVFKAGQTVLGLGFAGVLFAALL